MNIFLIGSGGREHALAWKILQSKRLTKLYVNNKNNLAKAEYIPVADQDIPSLVNFALEQKIDLVIIGGETPLAAGVSNALRAAGIRVFAPSQEAAQIETSKAFAKDFMARHNIPTARYETFSQLEPALNHVRAVTYPIVIKASGLAAGKGVFLPVDTEEADKILRELLQDRTLGPAGSEVIIEERLQGEEISLLAFSDGITVKAMPPARDYKRLHDGQQGPNTGGMGAFAPVPLDPAYNLDLLTTTILQPTIDGLRAEGKPFVGVIYAGLMFSPEGPKVLEFNCRFGDPETQVLLPLLDSDLVEIAQACTEQQLARCPIIWKPLTAVCVVLAAAGYPSKAQIGDVISGLERELPNSTIFQAGMLQQNSQWVTAGGRVLGVSAWGSDLTSARAAAYERIQQLEFPKMHYRKDIGQTTDLYAAAGVDITAGNRTVSLITAAVQSTYGPEVLAGIGAFGGMYDATSFKDMDRPVLVASTDGIGTKVHLAAQANQFDTLGFDIVHHSINDILVQGAKPLFFLDYVAASRLDAEKVAVLVTSMAEACRNVGCALLGGETAEMPDVYTPNSFDVAGTIVGVVERKQALPQPNLQAGDVLLGLASSGPHTNGYSLIRKIFQDVPLDSLLPGLDVTLGDALLAPHRCYLPILQAALQDSHRPIKALVHITGGGFYENIPRVLPDHLGAAINRNSWAIPPLFQIIQERGNVPMEQMYRVFNMGIGMIVIAAPDQVDRLQALIPEKLMVIGELTAGNKEVVL